MKVINISGIPFRFERNGRIIMVPFDRRVHEIPDECIKDDFRGFLKILEVPRYVNPPNIIEIDLGIIEQKVIEEVKDENKKPLSGVQIKTKKRDQILKSKDKRSYKKKEKTEIVISKEE